MAKILLHGGNTLILYFENSNCHIIGFFLSASKTATLTQYFDCIMAHFCPKQGSIAHKKFQRFQNWGEILS